MLRKAAILLLAVSLSGCAELPGAPSESHAMPSVAGPPGSASDLGELIYLGAQTLAERCGRLTKDRPIIVTTMVSIDDLSKSSTFGRLASELIANRLTQRGYQVRDVNYTGALTIKPETGELVLSREASKLSATINAQAIVAGTYAVGGQEIYLNIRLINADDGTVLSSSDVVLPRDRNIQAMVVGG